LPGLVRPVLLSGLTVAWFTGGSSRPGVSRAGQNRLGPFGSLPVRGSGGPVVGCVPLVQSHIADPGRCCPLVHAGDTLVCLGRPAERLGAGGLDLHGGSLRLGRVAPGRFQPLAGGGGVAGSAP
jgi:hypothetical protein